MLPGALPIRSTPGLASAVPHAEPVEARTTSQPHLASRWQRGRGAAFDKLRLRDVLLLPMDIGPGIPRPSC